MKKLTIILLILTVIGFADEYIVRVELTEDRLTPLFDKNLRIIGELENSAIVLALDSDFVNLFSLSYQILDQDVEEGRYYFVHPLDARIDLHNYGEILTQDGNDYFIKIKDGMLEELIKEKIMIKRLSFKPIIRKNTSSFQRSFSNSTVQEIVNEVSPDTVLSYVQRLQNFVTRYSTHDSCFAAADYIAAKFTDYGCDSIFLQYHTANHAPNVIGVKRGIIYPDSIYTVVCGHFDATSSMAPPIAPGADDNASGTAGVLEAARVMRDYEFEYSVRYIAFSGEEFGLFGSEYYAQLAHSQADSILGVFNADMIGYVDALPESLEVIAKISNPACEPLADFFIAAADTYTTLLTRKRMVNSMPYSDHQSFWEQGYVALLNAEDYWLQNPYYHQPGDTIGAGYNNNDFCTEVIKAQVAALSLMAIPYDTGIEEDVVVAANNTLLRVSPTIGNAHFTIFFEIDNPDYHATLNIYNVTGRLVRQLDYTISHANTHAQSHEPKAPKHITWDGTDNFNRKLPAGIYFIQLQDNESKKTEKLILLK